MRDIFLVAAALFFVLGSGITALSETAERLFLGLLLSSLALGLILLAISQRTIGSICLLCFLTLDALLFLYAKTLPLSGVPKVNMSRPSIIRISYRSLVVWFFILFLVGVFLLLTEIVPNQQGIATITPIKFADQIWGAGWFYSLALAVGATALALVGMGLVERKKDED